MFDGCPKVLAHLKFIASAGRVFEDRHFCPFVFAFSLFRPADFGEEFPCDIFLSHVTFLEPGSQWQTHDKL